MGPFGLDNGAFDNYMIDLPVIVSALSLGISVLGPPVIVRIVSWVGKCRVVAEALGFVVEVVAEGWLRS
jgi:hypothetical protein